MSETGTARPHLAPFCVGAGVDIGPGGDPINDTAFRVDYDPNPCAGTLPPHLVWDARTLPFNTNSLDYVYSSHALEDFEDTTAALKEWIRVIRPGGLLVLFLPDQVVYKAHCDKTGQELNPAHKHANFGLGYMMNCLSNLGYDQDDVVHQAWPVDYNPYSFSLVIRKKHE